MPWPSRWPDNIVFEETVGHEWLTDVSNSLAWLEPPAIATPVTSNVVVDVTSAATSELVIAFPAFTYEAVLHRLTVVGAGIDRTQSGVGAAGLKVGLYDGGAGSPLQTLEDLQAPATDAMQWGLNILDLFTPVAGSHTYQIRAYCTTADSFTFLAGNGGPDTNRPISAMIERLPIGS